MYTIILAGGFGTRLFPLSRTNYPKQFIPLFEGKSLFQKTVERALLTSSPDEIYVVTNAAHHFLVKDQLNSMNAPCNILEEPCGKNTLPALIYAALTIYRQDKDAVILVLPSDQYLEVNSAYTNAIEAAEKLASEYLITFGISPTTPHTGYGYIRSGKEFSSGYIVDAFVKKLNLETGKAVSYRKVSLECRNLLFQGQIHSSKNVRCMPRTSFNAFKNNPVATAYHRP